MEVGSQLLIERLTAKRLTTVNGNKLWESLERSIWFVGDYLAIDIRANNGLSSYQKGGEPMQAYCVKCRAKREMKDAKAITMKNGKPATQGICPTCGTKMFRIGKG